MNKHAILTSAPSPHNTHPRRSCMLLRTLTFIRKHVFNNYLLNKTLNIRSSRITILFCLADNVKLDSRDVDNCKFVTGRELFEKSDGPVGCA